MPLAQVPSVAQYPVLTQVPLSQAKPGAQSQSIVHREAPMDVHELLSHS